MTEVIRTQQEAYIENLKIMDAIVREMKEVAELPSETPKDISALEKVEFPVDGGVLTYMEGHPYAYRGFPYFEFVDKIDLIKKLSRGFLSGFYHSVKKTHKIWFITFLPSIWILKHFVRAAIYAFYRIIERFRIKPKYYSQAIRELYRAFSVQKDEKISDQELRFRIRDLLCMILEYDNAYRFRFQDLTEELNKENLSKDLLKEINKLFDIMSSREIGQDIKDTWTLVRLFISYYLRFDKKIKRILQDMLLELNVEQTKFTPEDIHFCEKRKDYVFGHQK